MGINTFTEEYVEQVFYLWYENDRKVSNGLVNNLSPNNFGHKPSKITITSWIGSNGWIERADALDAEVSRKMDEEIINKRMEMFKKHAEIGGELIERGRNFLNEDNGGIKTDMAALRAIDLGLGTERVSIGLAEAYVKISKMSDEQLSAQLQKLIGKKEETVDAEIIDTESE